MLFNNRLIIIDFFSWYHHGEQHEKESDVNREVENHYDDLEAKLGYEQSIVCQHNYCTFYGELTYAESCPVLFMMVFFLTIFMTIILSYNL